jgi:hypothetical protein
MEQFLPFIGFGAVAGGLALAAIAHIVCRKRDALLGGVGVVGRWRVGPPEWAAFRRRDAARDGLFHSLRNRLPLPAELPPEGLEIRIGTDAMLVGDACYGLGSFVSRGNLIDVARADGSPAMLEFTTLRQSAQQERLKVFRVPIADSARAEGQAVLDHFDGTMNPRGRESMRKYFGPHFQAASGDAGEAEAARATDRRRRLRSLGFTLLLVGGLALGTCLSTTPGPNGDPVFAAIFTIASAAIMAAGLIALAMSGLSRRQD